ncbi:MAG: DNA mismatch repair endonuclease MutL [Clostridia bacterium]|nr:DNA mismatch repair endonuclease MutL [Clostridia bacterium]MBR2634861.1 DNA mismatch repair endonuclease MutL [Clostridia bacterium]
MGIINILDPQVANLIAAGEVVDRPASVIKELLENAIDAGATAVTVEIKRGGITFMRVSDNGCGMSRDDVPVCIKRHATSKIRTEGDLDSIITLGFRGEALAAIGSVSTLRIMTKTKDSEMGTVLTCVGGEIREIIESGCPNGTTIIVEELFANIPARRKFLKKDTSEALACAAVVEKIALSRPDLSIKFISDGQLRFSTEGDGNLKNCVYAVLGRDFAKKLVEVHGMTGGIEVLGYIGTPENVRANRNYQNFFINGRYVKSRTAMAAIEQAFNSYIPSEKFPVCVLELRIHPALVDVNVHPAKLEVKFSNEQAVFDSVYSAVRTALEDKLPRPELSLKTKEEARREARIVSGFVPLKESPSDIQTGKGEQLSMQMQEKRAQAVSDMHLYTKHAEELPPHLRFGKGSANGEKPSVPFAFDNSLDNTITTSSSKATEVSNSDIRTVEPKKSIAETYKNEPAGSPISTPVSAPKKPQEKSSKQEIAVTVSALKELSSAPVTENPPDYSVSAIPRPSATKEIKDVPPYKYLGEAFNSYVMVESEGTLLLIDKHAAHERILFEDMKQNLDKGSDSQILLVPITVTVSGEELDAAQTYREEILAMGFDFTQSDLPHSVNINAIPSGISANEAEELFVTVCGQLAAGTGSLEVTKRIFFEQALYQASCKAAIKAGRLYDEAHIKWICERVLTDSSIRFCPHGRPVAFELTKGEIEHRFKRK